MKKQIDGQISLFDYFSDGEAYKKKTVEQNECSTVISLYQECINCWCRDCRHNEKLEAIPRDFAGTQKPCPACIFCMKANQAEICEINSYENGCKLRAMEEGIKIE